MTFDPQKHHRRSIRLPGYDYSQPGAYFITLVTRGRECIFGSIQDGVMQLSEAGWIVHGLWCAVPDRFRQTSLGAYVVMPNHFHGILIVNEPPSIGAIHELPQRESPLQESPQPELPTREPLLRGEARASRRRMLLPLVVGYFKMNTAGRINRVLGPTGAPVWQRNYYERIIRDGKEYTLIERYIEANIDNWAMDDENPTKPK